MNRVLRLGLVGMGYWGKNLLRVFQSQPNVELCGIADPALDPRTSRVPVFPSLESLLAQCQLDAVAIATPPSTHYALARRCLEAGKHCWVEKPLALRAAEAAELVALAEKKGCQLFVDETFLYDPLVRTARQWIREGYIGEIRHLSFQRLGQGRIRRDSDVWWNSAPHDLSILFYWIDKPVQAVRVETFAYLQPGLADVAVGTLRLQDNVSAHVYLSWIAPQKIATATVVGSQGMVVFEGRFGKRKLERYDFQVAEPTAVTGNVVPIEKFACVETLTGGTQEPLALAAEAFVEAVFTGVLPPSAGLFSQRVVEVLEAGVPQ